MELNFDVFNPKVRKISQKIIKIKLILK